VPPFPGFWCFLGVRNNLSSNVYTLKILDANDASGTAAYRFKTPGALAGDPTPASVYTVNPANDGSGNGSEEGWTTIGVTSTSGAWRVIDRQSVDAAQRGIRKFDTTHSPVALYNFEGNLNDSSGNGLTLTTGGTVVYRKIWPGLLAMVSGTPTRVANDALLTILGDVTVEAICAMSSTTLSVALVAMQGAGELEVNNSLYQLIISDQNTLQSFTEHGAGTDDVFNSTGANQGLPQLNIPFHLAIVRASNVIRFYLNGELFGSASSTLTAPTGGSSANLRINATNVPLASVKIIASALTATQIRAEYNRTMGPAAGFLA